MAVIRAPHRPLVSRPPPWRTMAAFAVVRAATAAALVLCAFAACGRVVPAARGSGAPGATPPVVTTPSTGSSLIALGPRQGTLDEAAGRRLTTWLTVIVLAGGGQDATGDPGARPNGYGRWASRIWLRAADSDTAQGRTAEGRTAQGGTAEGRVSIDVYADVQDRQRWQRETAPGPRHLIAGPLWTITTSSARDEALVRRHLARASARTTPLSP
ncbi:hypothetical protein [Parafrankia sp. FMc2]|uniref:hypothetical protein n=1 Tax=Parafrankia sp. FMc2 TaxID=3233196 RepID=UPI0034D6C82A